uniref:Uncharacterized protein n=1 Tax=Chromera velia CCMP2878 TaxID=1169474 RepID=A0A0G4FE74_9ALVE|eukprot:Cvel_3253.t1-p1 / transcript=Cvel_3253.t1 / gene=Cvel_3253 / organism=Chromera_velia_CCMP2878 / gene_product=hypothetical protein / transcript_product=hypothetical protein / location=Cvel_scaffold127:119255-121315(+) / protein_length=98 / sequence_SO=supercontig / SO=protein_coding / is_pseudo=false
MSRGIQCPLISQAAWSPVSEIPFESDPELCLCPWVESPSESPKIFGGRCRCFGSPLGSLGIASPPRSTGVDESLGGASRLCASIYVEPDGMPAGVSLR